MTDTQRLDWLEKNHDTVSIFPDWHHVVNPEESGKCWHVDDGKRICISTRTLREAVDRAMASESAAVAR